MIDGRMPMKKFVKKYPFCVGLILVIVCVVAGCVGVYAYQHREVVEEQIPYEKNWIADAEQIDSIRVNAMPMLKIEGDVTDKAMIEEIMDYLREVPMYQVKPFEDNRSYNSYCMDIRYNQGSEPVHIVFAHGNDSSVQYEKCRIDYDKDALEALFQKAGTYIK